MADKINIFESYRIYFEELNSVVVYLNNFPDPVFNNEI